MNLQGGPGRLANALPIHAVRARQLVSWELRNGEPELKLVQILHDTSRDFLDIGANKGVYSLCALGHYRKVIAVEAHPDMAVGLRRLIKPDNEVLSVALSDEVGETKLHIPTRHGRDVLTRSSLRADANPGFSQRTVTVPTTTIDELGLAEPAVIKIDVEGHEASVLRGGIRTLQTARPICIVECEERHNPGGIAQTFSLFDSMGYRGYFVHRNRLRDASEFRTSDLQRPEDSKPVGGRRSVDYVNNFVFVHRENDDQINKICTAFKAL